MKSWILALEILSAQYDPRNSSFLQPRSSVWKRYSQMWSLSSRGKVRRVGVGLVDTGGFVWKWYSIARTVRTIKQCQ